MLTRSGCVTLSEPVRNGRLAGTSRGSRRAVMRDLLQGQRPPRRRGLLEAWRWVELQDEA